MLRIPRVLPFPLCCDHIVLSLLQRVVSYSGWFINMKQTMFYLGPDPPSLLLFREEVRRARARDPKHGAS